MSSIARTLAERHLETARRLRELIEEDPVRAVGYQMAADHVDLLTAILALDARLDAAGIDEMASPVRVHDVELAETLAHAANLDDD